MRNKKFRFCQLSGTEVVGISIVDRSTSTQPRKAALTFRGSLKIRPALPAVIDEGNAMKVSLNFNDDSYEILQEIKQRWDFVSDAETIREALTIMRALVEQDKEGYSEVIVQNSEGDQRSLDIEFLKRHVAS